MSKHDSFQSGKGWTPIVALGPAAAFNPVDDVVDDPRLTRAEKRAILASWSSDASAVENAPQWRRLDSGALVKIDALLRALASLDGAGAQAKRRPQRPAPAPRRRNALSRWLSRVGSPRGGADDDDDPPPAPAGIAIPFRPIFVGRPEHVPSAARARA